MFEEEKYKPLRSILRSLPKVKAKKGFEQRLFSRIKGVESEKSSVPSIEKLIHRERYGWITSIFRPSLSPVLGLTVILLLVLIVYTYVDVIQKQEEISRSITLEQTHKPDLTIYDRNERLSTGTEKSIEERTQPPTDAENTHEKVYIPQPPKTETEFTPVPEDIRGPALEDVKRSTIDEKIIDDKIEGKMMEKDEITLPKEDERTGEKNSEDVMKKIDNQEIPETKGEEKIKKEDYEQKIAPFQYDDKKRKGVNDTIIKKDSVKTKENGKKVDKKEDPLNKKPEEKKQEPDSLK